MFSRQAVQMDALISGFVEDIKQRAALYSEDSDGNVFTDNSATEADGNDLLLCGGSGSAKGTTIWVHFY